MTARTTVDYDTGRCTIFTFRHSRKACMLSQEYDCLRHLGPGSNLEPVLQHSKDGSTCQLKLNHVLIRITADDSEFMTSFACSVGRLVKDSNRTALPSSSCVVRHYVPWHSGVRSRFWFITWRRTRLVSRYISTLTCEVFIFRTLSYNEFKTIASRPGVLYGLHNLIAL
jgi:hypothetical protein